MVDRITRKCGLAGLDGSTVEAILDNYDVSGYSYTESVRYNRRNRTAEEYGFWEYDENNIADATPEKHRDKDYLELFQAMCLDKKNNPDRFTLETYYPILARIDWKDVSAVSIYYLSQVMDKKEIIQKYDIRSGVILTLFDFNVEELRKDDVWPFIKEKLMYKKRYSSNQSNFYKSMDWLIGENSIYELAIERPELLGSRITWLGQDDIFDDIFFIKFNEEQRKKFFIDIYSGDKTMVVSDDLVQRIFAVDSSMIKYLGLFAKMDSCDYRDCNILNLLIKSVKGPDSVVRSENTSKWRYSNEIRRAAALARACKERNMTIEIKQLLKESVPLIKLYNYDWDQLFPVVFPQYASTEE